MSQGTIGPTARSLLAGIEQANAPSIYFKNRKETQRRVRTKGALLMLASSAVVGLELQARFAKSFEQMFD